MASGFEIEFDPSALVEILRSDGVADMLKRKADRVKASAGPGMESGVELEAHRARASVWTATFEARAAEARDRVLTRAVDAARG